jgi:hypothetical protein
MCDYSLETIKTRPAKVGDKLFTRRFSSATGGFCAPEDIHVAVCLLPGTELSFAYLASGRCRAGWSWSPRIEAPGATSVSVEPMVASTHGPWRQDARARQAGIGTESVSGR